MEVGIIACKQISILQLLILTGLVAIGLKLLPIMHSVGWRLTLAAGIGLLARVGVLSFVQMRSGILLRCSGFVVSFLTIASCLTLLLIVDRPTQWKEDIEQGFSLVVLVVGTGLSITIECFVFGWVMGIKWFYQARDPGAPLEKGRTGKSDQQTER